MSKNSCGLMVVLIAMMGTTFLVFGFEARTQTRAFSEEWPEFQKPTTLADTPKLQTPPSEPNPAGQSDKAVSDPSTIKSSESADPSDRSEGSTWTKKFGKSISIRGTDERLYIQAGETRIVLDQSGDLTISSSNSLTIGSKKNILFKAGEDIQFQAGGKVVQQGGTP